MRLLLAAGGSFVSSTLSAGAQARGGNYPVYVQFLRVPSSPLLVEFPPRLFEAKLREREGEGYPFLSELSVAFVGGEFLSDLGHVPGAYETGRALTEALRLAG